MSNNVYSYKNVASKNFRDDAFNYLFHKYWYFSCYFSESIIKSYEITNYCLFLFFKGLVEHYKMNQGYLHYKTITYQNMSTAAQIKIFCFVLETNYVLFSRFSSFSIFNNPMIYQICYVMTSIAIWGRVHFWIYLLNHNSLSHQTWSSDRYKQG